jgi:YHS domain-containing protein
MTLTQCKHSLFAVAFSAILSLFTFSHALAIEPVYTGFFSSNAVGGYDTVSFFKNKKPTKGKSQFSTSYKGATWLFSSQDNLNAFKKNPDQYAPQYGGYCAWAISQGYDASGSPKHYKIVDGKLYLNYNAGIQKKWMKNIPKHIASANKNWPNLVDAN